MKQDEKKMRSRNAYPKKKAKYNSKQQASMSSVAKTTKASKKKAKVGGRLKKDHNY